MFELRIGGQAEYIRVLLPSSYSRDGWCQADVEVSVEGFKGNIRPWFEKADFAPFYAQLRTLYETLKGKAELTPLEAQFTLTVSADGLGHVTVDGTAWSQATWQNKLEFTLALDQTYLVEPLAQLKAITEAHANVGA